MNQGWTVTVLHLLTDNIMMHSRADTMATAVGRP
jgi:hypothetical protein